MYDASNAQKSRLSNNMISSYISGVAIGSQRLREVPSRDARTQFTTSRESLLDGERFFQADTPEVAHSSRQVLTFGPKTCLLFGYGPLLVMPLACCCT